MMKVSSKGRYALRIMLVLARTYESEKLCAVKDISTDQGISEKYAEQIIAALKQAGALRSIRGAQGGYRLSKAPDQYKVGDIIRIVEGSTAPVACLEDEENQCDRAHNCVSLKLWVMLEDAINGVIDHVTLQDMLDWEKEGNMTEC